LMKRLALVLTHRLRSFLVAGRSYVGMKLATN
jgi:hypothetical protein